MTMLTKENDIEFFNMVFTPGKESCPVAQQCVLVASEVASVLEYKHIPTVDVAKHREVLAVEKLHCLNREVRVADYKHHIYILENLAINII